MMDRKSLLAIFSIALAIIVPLLMAVQSNHEMASNPVIKVKITGYDPRDLLYGHYMNFQYDWNWDKTAENNCNGEDCCLCVEAKETNPKVNVQQCSVAKTSPTCAHIVKGSSYSGTNFYGPSTQFFVDETKALPLEAFFRKHSGKKEFLLGLSLPPSGKARIDKLYIEGKTYLEYMDAHPEEFVMDENGTLQETPADPAITEPTPSP